MFTPFRLAGAWVIAIKKAFDGYDLSNAAFDPYEAVIQAGKAAKLLSSIRKLGCVSIDRLNIYRKLAGLKPQESLILLKEMERLNIVSVEWDLEGSHELPIKFAQALQPDESTIGEQVAELFLSLRPSDVARAAVDVLAITVKLPRSADSTIQSLVERGHHENAVSRAISDLVAFKLLASTNDTLDSSPLLFNPLVFQSNAQLVHAALTKLVGTDRDEALEVIDQVQKNPGVPFPRVYKKEVLDILVSCGLVDVSAVLARGGQVRKEFATAPYIWGAYAGGDIGRDVLDDAKLFLNSLRFGEYFSSPERGKIDSPLVLVDRLISRGRVGPATAIGQDYPLPLARGIVSIAESQLYRGRFDMLLLKEDVATSVRDVLQSGYLEPRTSDDETSVVLMSQQGQFVSPDQIRIERTLPPELEQARDALAFELRTYQARR